MDVWIRFNELSTAKINFYVYKPEVDPDMAVRTPSTEIGQNPTGFHPLLFCKNDAIFGKFGLREILMQLEKHSGLLDDKDAKQIRSKRKTGTKSLHGLALRTFNTVEEFSRKLGCPQLECYLKIQRKNDVWRSDDHQDLEVKADPKCSATQADYQATVRLIASKKALSKPDYCRTWTSSLRAQGWNDIPKQISKEDLCGLEHPKRMIESTGQSMPVSKTDFSPNQKTFQ